MDGRKIKALFFDIDGTLIGLRSHRHNDTDLDSLKKLKEKVKEDDGYALFRRG